MTRIHEGPRPANPISPDVFPLAHCEGLPSRFHTENVIDRLPFHICCVIKIQFQQIQNKKYFQLSRDKGANRLGNALKKELGEKIENSKKMLQQNLFIFNKSFVE